MRNSNLKLFSLVCGFLLCFQVAFAQQKDVKGMVKDVSGEPLIGVSVVAKGHAGGATIGTVTDFDGNYVLSVPADTKTLEVSYIGMITQNLPLNKSVIDVVLKEDIAQLDEVVVIGYGTVKRKDITGSVASVNADAIAAIPVASAVEAISGKLAGVQITTTEGSPDAEMKVRVRGGGSITGDNAPLFIVDGFPVQSINDIAPTDIESIDVLKDASSTAIYGSRGANGVIIVTTKSGKEGKVNINYNAYVGWKKIAKKLDVLSAYDYASWQYERAMLADGKPDKYAQFFGNYQDMDIYNDISTNDWQEQVFGRTGFTFNHNLSISGGGDKTKYSFSYNHMDDKAIMQMSGFRRENLSLKLNNKINDVLTVDFSARYSETEIKGAGANEQNEKSSSDSRLKNAMIYPSFPVMGLTDGDDTDDSFNLYNPLVSISDNDQLQNRKSYNMNGGITWEPIKDLRLKTELGLDDYRESNDRFYGTTTYYVKNAPKGEYQGLPAVVFRKASRQSFRNTNTINYDFKKLMPENNNLNLLLGQEYVITKQESLTSTVHGFPKTFTFDNARKLSAQGAANSIDNYFSPDDKLFSFFARANYDFDSKYLLSATFRADGSSKFIKGSNKWGYFPSAAFAWRISSESFMENTKNWLDDLKLRASYGTAGNNKIPSGQGAQSYDVSTTTWVNGFDSYWAASKNMANPDLKWETTITRNLGLDVTTLGGRLNATVEAYLNTTKDLLIEFPVAGTGYDSQYRNLGETQNKGFEVSLNWVAVDKKDFGLSISANIAFNKNRVNSLGSMESIPGVSGWASTDIGPDYWIAEGGSIGRMYGYLSGGRYEVSDFKGYDAATNSWILRDDVVDSTPIVGKLRPGSMKLLKTTDGLLVNTDDKTVIGDANPIHTGGFTLNGRAYGFDLAANFTWSYGNDVYNANKIEYTSTSKYHSRNMISEMAAGNRWNNLLPDGTICNDPDMLTEMNQNTTLWSPYMRQFVFSDWAVEDASFLRLSALTLGYTLPKSVINKVKLQNCRFYVTGHNVFCLTNYSGFDPEVSTRRKTSLTPGVDYSAYPKSRSIVVGLNLNF
jgi:TonB-linked outer membrane protein, SusC/RagA family